MVSTFRNIEGLTMALTVRKIEIAPDGSVANETFLPYLCLTKDEAKEAADREAKEYPKSEENREEGCFWARDGKGRKFLFIPCGI